MTCFGTKLLSLLNDDNASFDNNVIISDFYFDKLLISVDS